MAIIQILHTTYNHPHNNLNFLQHQVVPVKAAVTPVKTNIRPYPEPNAKAALSFH